jgi:hypothetical protein
VEGEGREGIAPRHMGNCDNDLKEIEGGFVDNFYLFKNFSL